MRNRLQNETSPYLLQHASNPVDWFPWGDEALSKAKKENKLLIISIGYAACHWCHVMEKECFENNEAASFMNEHFVSIKVDREERPDIDQIYMEAVQILTGSGGWPLNVIALPDGKPIYGGTYFPRDNWILFLTQILNYMDENREKVFRQSAALAEAINSSLQEIPVKDNLKIDIPFIETIFHQTIFTADTVRGGQLGAPKFPMPSVQNFFLHYGIQFGNDDALGQCFLTLKKMAEGGIYDQIGGGFARYSVDSMWKVPHFEKMLYDNAQLISLYSKAYKITENPLYKQIILETIDFVEKELESPEGGFYSSLDADSEGEEGKFYIWTEEELDLALNDLSPPVKTYYSVKERGNWENGKNIFRVAEDVPAPGNLKKIKKDLQAIRSKRIKPSLDNKILAAWNGLMLRALVDAYQALQISSILEKANRSAHFISENLFQGESLVRSGNIKGFLDDYAFIADGFIGLYESTFENLWLEKAMVLTEYSLKHFSDNHSPLLFYTSDLDLKLIARKKEISDNVIPSSNSQTALNLYRLGYISERDELIDRAVAMAQSVSAKAEKHSTYYANWNILFLMISAKPYHVTIQGKESELFRRDILKNFIPGLIISEDKNDSEVSEKTEIRICRDRYCLKPVYSVEEALSTLTAQIL